ncbi:MAG: polyketide synthase dehydratase domain-containing protein [Desulfobacterales bacterium]|nr:polyketide synthase dehydratase domain-containing protein [Desulfobacterales bacterium]
MEDLPGLAAPVQLPLHVPLAPYLHDHRFDGRAVLPAVEALDLLARAARRHLPGLDVTRMRQAAFDRFLPIDPGAPFLEATVELSRRADGSLAAVLATRAVSRSGAMTRTKSHAAAVFGGPAETAPELPLDLAAAPEGVCLTLAGEGIYPELVAFGPAYRNLVTLHLSRAGAVADVATPAIPAAGPLGSPFAFDAAMHAACIWGQRFAGIVPFPVGFDERRVFLPTRPGEGYWAHVLPVAIEGVVLSFELRLYDGEGRLRELCLGLRMRDVSAGRMRPPAGVRAGDEPLGRLAAACRAFSVVELAALAPFAERTLSAPELARVEGLRGRRRASCTAARLACKRLARQLSGGDDRTPPGAITTVRPERPQLPACPRTDGRGAGACSVAHDRRFAVAVAAEGSVGVDVEALDERVLRSRALFMHPAEEALVRASALGEVAAAVRIWSVKEAVTKALDIPLAAAWARVEVTSVGEGESRLRLDDREELRAVHDRVEDHVFTVVGGQFCDPSDRTDRTD